MFFVAKRLHKWHLQGLSTLPISPEKPENRMAAKLSASWGDSMRTSSQQSRWKIPLTQLPVLKEALQSDVEQAKARRDQRKLVREICSLPEVRALPPEQFFVAFKQAVSDAANDLGVPDGPERDQLLSRLLSISIEEFFHTDGNGDGNGDGDGNASGDGDGRFTQMRSWSERLGLSMIRNRLNGNSHQSKDEECRGRASLPHPTLHRSH